MRKLFAVIAVAGLMSSCSSAGSETSGSASTASTGTTASSGTTAGSDVDSGSTTPATTGLDSAATSTPGTPPVASQPPLVPATVPADCPEPTPTTAATVLADPVDKPEIELPDPLPTELETIDLVDGEGPAAKNGDQVQVYYIGVRSNDGVEFDSNFGSGTPFPLQLGAGGVIPGWEQGLVGVKAGTRRQLNIPPALAYGDQAQGEQIPPNTPLTFIVDVVSVQPGPAPTEPPDYTFPTVAAGAEFATETLVEGDPCDIAQIGTTVLVNIQLVRGDTGEVLDDTWEKGAPVPLGLDETTIWGLAQGLAGLGLGGRRLITIPPDLGIGAEGNQANGLDPDTVLLAYVEFVAHA